MLWLLRASICGLMFWTCSIALADATVCTHKHTRALSPVHEGVTLHLRTFCMGPDENLWLCCGGLQGVPEKGGILVLQPSGEFVRLVPLDFIPTAINFTPDGTAAFVAGGGMLAKLSAQGEVLKAVPAPNLLSEEELRKKLQADFEESLKRMAEDDAKNQERLTKQLEKLKSQIAAAEEQGDERALNRAQSRVKIVQEQLDSMKEVAAAGSTQQGISTDTLLTIVKDATAVAVTKEDVFVSLGGLGYEIWRMNHDLEDGRCIKDNIGGCCEQLDIQADGNDILIAANTLFSVVRMDRDAKELSSFGERGDGGSGSGWGSCCNPMNIRVVGDEVLVAESSVGHLKRYTKDGKYLGLVGTARIGGGCKHVAVAVDTKRNWYFMMNENSNNIAVLIPKEELPSETEEERLAHEAYERLAQKMLGSWECSNEEIAQAAGDLSYALEMYSRMQFHSNGELSLPEQPKAGDVAYGMDELASGDPLMLDSSLDDGSSQLQPMESPLNAHQLTERNTWEAVRQDHGQLHFVARHGGAGDWGGVVSFVDDETITIQWCGGGTVLDGTLVAIGNPVTYKRVPDQARADGDQGGNVKK